MRSCTLRGTMMVPITANVTSEIDAQGSHWQDIFLNQNEGLVILKTGMTPTPISEQYITKELSTTGKKTGFLGTARLSLANAGDAVTWEMPYYALGHTSFRNINPVIRGTGTNNLSAQFQYDNTTNGFNGQWLTLNASNLSGINIDPQIGIKLKIKVSAIATTNNTTTIFLFLYTNTDAVSQQIKYPLPKQQKGILSNLVPNTRVQLYNETTQTELYNDVHLTTNDFIYEYNLGEGISSEDIIRIRLTCVNNTNAKSRQELFTQTQNGDFFIYIIQTEDEIYNNIGLDGSTITEFVPDYPMLQVDINDADQRTNLARLYSWWVANEHTADGIRNYFEGLVAEDASNFKINTSIVDLKLDNVSNAGVVFEGDYRM
jgi:hypothetical protein